MHLPFITHTLPIFQPQAPLFTEIFHQLFAVHISLCLQSNCILCLFEVLEEKKDNNSENKRSIAPMTNEPLHKVSFHQLQIKRKPTTALAALSPQLQETRI